MPSITDVTARFLAAPVPVLLADTCSLVDVIRAPKRLPVLKGCISNAVELRRMVIAAPAECQLVIGSFVPAEWTKHAEPTRDELQRHLEALDEAYQVSHDSCSAVGIAIDRRASLGSSGLSAALHALSADLLGKAIHLDAQDDTNLRAFARAAANLPPSTKGGEIKDSTILEECLALCRNLRAAGFAERIVYCTSNTADYCVAGKLHVEIQDEFSPLMIRFVTTLPWAVAELKR